MRENEKESISKQVQIPENRKEKFIEELNKLRKKYNVIIEADYINSGEEISYYIHGYATNVREAVSNIHYEYHELEKGDILPARELVINDDEVYIKLPNGQKGIIRNLNEINHLLVRDAVKYKSGNTKEIKVVDIELEESFRPIVPKESAETVGGLVMQALDKKNTTEYERPKKDGYLDVKILPQITETLDADTKGLVYLETIDLQLFQDKFNVILQRGEGGKTLKITGSTKYVQIAKDEILKTYNKENFSVETTTLDKCQMKHFIGKGQKNRKALEEEFDVSFNVHGQDVTIIGEKYTVMLAKAHIENLYKDTVFEVEINRFGCNRRVNVPGLGLVKLSFKDGNNRINIGTLESGMKVQVAVFNRRERFQKVEFIKIIGEAEPKKQDNQKPKVDGTQDLPNQIIQKIQANLIKKLTEAQLQEIPQLIKLFQEIGQELQTADSDKGVNNELAEQGDKLFEILKQFGMFQQMTLFDKLIREIEIDSDIEERLYNGLCNIVLKEWDKIHKDKTIYEKSGILEVNDIKILFEVIIQLRDLDERLLPVAQNIKKQLDQVGDFDAEECVNYFDLPEKKRRMLGNSNEWKELLVFKSIEDRKNPKSQEQVILNKLRKVFLDETKNERITIDNIKNIMYIVYNDMKN